MEVHPSKLTKSNTNTNLLNLLTKRSAKSITTTNNNWPGLHAPSLANITIRRHNQKSVKYKLINNNNTNPDHTNAAYNTNNNADLKLKRSFSLKTKTNINTNTNKNTNTDTRSNFYKSNPATNQDKYIKNMPLIKMSSDNLSLIPSQKSRTIAMHTTWRSANSNYNINNNNISKSNRFLDENNYNYNQNNHNNNNNNNHNIHNNTNQQQLHGSTNTIRQSSSGFKNSKVCELINKQPLQQYKRKQILQLVKNYQNQVKINTTGNMTTNANTNANNNNNIGNQNLLKDYVIDYNTFNYIEKVIDNPQKWEKYVHKKQRNGVHNLEFLTSIKLNIKSKIQ